jgi:hypothetical protein
VIFSEVLDKSTSDGNTYESHINIYIEEIKEIILLNPNIDIPLDIINKLFKTEEDITDLISGLELGLVRYTRFVLNKFEEVIAARYGYKSPTEEGDEGLKDNQQFLYMSIPEQLQYVFNDVENISFEIEKECHEINGKDDNDCSACEYSQKLPKLNNDAKDKDFYHCTLTNRPASIIYNNDAFRAYDLKGIFERTNAYIKGLKNLIQENVRELEEVLK